MGKITVIGSINMDMVMYTAKIPTLGETVIGDGFISVHGGKGANQAVAASRLGGDVSMVGYVGGDSFGEKSVRNLIDNGVNVDHVFTVEGCTTGIAFVVVKDGDNFIILHSGANSILSSGKLDTLEEQIKNSNLIMLQYECPADAVEKAIQLARKHKVKVLVNPAPARVTPDNIMSCIDVFTPNLTEAEQITGITIKNLEDAGRALEYIRDKGIKQVIITMGSMGVLYNNGNIILHQDVYRVKAIDTTAAGDAFSGALAVALDEGKGIDEAVGFANMAGALAVMKKGAQTSLPSREDIDNFEKRYK